MRIRTYMDAYNHVEDTKVYLLDRIERAMREFLDLTDPRIPEDDPGKQAFTEFVREQQWNTEGLIDMILNWQGYEESVPFYESLEKKKRTRRRRSE